MGALEDINEMRSRGVSDEEITKNLQEKGTSPKEINDAFSNSQIQTAVSNENLDTPTYDELQSQNFQAPSPKNYTPKTQELSNEESYYPQNQEQEFYQGAPTQEDFGSYQAQGFDTDTIIEISEQVFLEKIQKIQKQVEELSEFKVLSESRIESLLERTKKMESLMDRLQIAILGKIDSYGDNLEGIKKEMSMMQDSFGKIIPKVMERVKNSKSIPKIPIKKSSGDETLSKLKKISKKK